MGGWQGERSRQVPAETQDESGSTLTGEREKGEALTRHYQRLADGVVGRSRDPSYRKDKVGERGAERTEGLDLPFAAEELYEAARRLPNNRAPGEDGTAAERTRELPPTERESGAGASPSCAAEVVLGLLSRVRQEGCTPSQRRKAAAVSTCKKGDPAGAGSCRGVPPAPVPFKLLPTAVAVRVQDAKEALGIFAGEQAGLRPQEECPGQVAASAEALGTRCSRTCPGPAVRYLAKPYLPSCTR